MSITNLFVLEDHKTRLERINLIIRYLLIPFEEKSRKNKNHLYIHIFFLLVTMKKTNYKELIHSYIYGTYD
jgi:hypothetical protein